MRSRMRPSHTILEVAKKHHRIWKKPWGRLARQSDSRGTPNRVCSWHRPTLVSDNARLPKCCDTVSKCLAPFTVRSYAAPSPRRIDSQPEHNETVVQGNGDGAGHMIVAGPRGAQPARVFGMNVSRVPPARTFKPSRTRATANPRSRK